jgi:hypothetical protein
MTKTIIILCLFIFFTFNSFGQNKKYNNEVSISVPFLWSKYEVTNLWGIYGVDKQSNGESWSNGINVTYSKKLFKGLFITGGIGYFKQKFDFSKSRTPSGGGFRTSNSRPFQYNSTDRLLFSTKHYCYNNYHFILGMGYNYPISTKLDIKGDITYNQMNTYKQKYFTDYANYAPQVNRLNYLFSKSFIFSVGGAWKLSKKISAGLNVLIPLSTKYRKDYIFKENTSEYFVPTSSLGLSLSTNYHF